MIKKLMVTVVLLSMLVGCNTAPNWNNTLYVSSNGVYEYYFHANDPPQLLITDYNNYYYMPLLKDLQIIDSWYNSNGELLMYIDESYIISNSPNGFTYMGEYKWLFTNTLAVLYTHVNGQILEDPFTQVIIFKHIDQCKSETTTYTFGVKVDSDVYRCILNNT